MSHRPSYPDKSETALMPAILLAVTGLDPQPWEQRFRALAPQRDIRLWPQRLGDPADIAYACAWHAPRGLLARLPRLAAIFSLGAGVDHVVADPELPNVAVVRIVDPDLTMRMTEYVVLHVLLHHRRQRLYDAQQRERVWREHEQSPASAVAVGVMGLGVLGRDAAAALARLGFRVAGWSRTPKTLAGVETFHGDEGLDAFLQRTEVLVCLLPATPATHGILRLDLLRKLKRDGATGGAYLINAARGALQVDADILAALDEGCSRAQRSTSLRANRWQRRARSGGIPRSPSRRTTPRSPTRARSSPTCCARSSAWSRACRSSTWSILCSGIRAPCDRVPIRLRRSPGGVVPGRATLGGASPQSIITGGGYGFRAPSLRSGPGMTTRGTQNDSGLLKDLDPARRHSPWCVAAPGVLERSGGRSEPIILL
jgi:glyoxylate/hydroxypyruvate reductase